VIKFQAICNYFRNQKGVGEGRNKNIEEKQNFLPTNLDVRKTWEKKFPTTKCEGNFVI
jgi:hypothetical protein